MESSKWWESRTIIIGLIAMALVVGLVLGGRALGVSDEMVRGVMEWIGSIALGVMGLNKGGKIAGKVADAMTSRRTAEAVARAESEGE